MSMIQKSEWFDDKVKKSHKPEKCVYQQKPEFYIHLNNQLLSECDWCPYHTDCEICGGLDDVLMNECYSCNKCHLWD